MYTACGHTICKTCDAQITNVKCPVCRTCSKTRCLTTINNDYCAGECLNSHYKCNKILIAECGHMYYGKCIHDMVINSSSLLSYINGKTHINQDIKCKLCVNIYLTKWLKVFLNF